MRYLLSLFVIISVAASADSLTSFRLETFSDSELRSVGRQYELHREEDGSMEVLVPTAEAVAFQSRFPQAEIAEWDIKNIFRRMDETEPGWREKYHSFSEVESQLKELAQKYPDLVEVQQYGSSANGRPLYVATVGTSARNAPQIMLTAATHGDELITVEVLMAILERLVKGYGEDPRINRILASHTIYIVPVVNPDGFVKEDRYDNGRDPNRSFPWPGNPNATPTASIRGLIDFFHKHQIVGSIDFHASGKYIMYPWAYTDKSVDAKELDWYKSTSRAMADINGYRPGQISKIMYVAQGSSADYWQWKAGTLAFGIEMASSKVPSPSQIPAVVKENMESTLLFLEYF